MKQNTPDEASSLNGSIICTASNAGLYPFPIAPLYSATKHAVVGLVRSLGRPLQEQNIQINALAPNVIRKSYLPHLAASSCRVVLRHQWLKQVLYTYRDKHSQ